jgi:phage FluMu protein Com
VSKSNCDIRCCKCNAKLAEAEIENGWVSIKCKCGVVNLVTASKEKAERGPEKEKREYGDNPGARH